MRANVSPIGIIPSTEKRIMPGIKKLLKGELSNIDRGIPNSLPVGEIIKTPPPKIAPNPRSPIKIKRIFRAVFVFIILFTFLCPSLVAVFKYTQTNQPGAEVKRVADSFLY